MPLLQVDLTGEVDDATESFADRVTDAYAEHMETGTGHVAVVVRERKVAALHLGRADADEPCLFLNADVRRGRTVDQKRAFALSVIDIAAETLSIPKSNAKVVFTEHAGEDMMGYDRVGAEWSPSEGDG